MNWNAPETLQRLSVAEMKAVAAAADAYWASKGQDGFSVTNPRLLAPLFSMFVTAIGYGVQVDSGETLPYLRIGMICCEVGFFAIFCAVAGQLAWNHWSRTSLIKRARDIGVDVATLDESAMERWVLRPLRAREHSRASAD